MSSTTDMSSTTNNNNTVQLWNCADRACNTGQTFLNRSEYGRKVVSDFFGRNKRETKEIHQDVWHTMCRKSYQRNKYNAEKSGTKAVSEFYIEHIKAQLERIKLWRPEATFTVQLEKPAKERLNRYHSILRRNGADVDGAKQQVAHQAKMGTKGKPKPLTLVEAVKIEHAEHIDASFSGEGKTLDYLSGTILPWIEGEVEKGEMVQMPPIEFLLNKAAAGEQVVDATTNYERWVCLVDGLTYQPPSPPKKAKLTLTVAPREQQAPAEERPKIILSLKKKKSCPAAALPLYQPPSPLVPAEKKGVMSLLSPPPPPAKRAASADLTTTTTQAPKKRPASIDVTLANSVYVNGESAPLSSGLTTVELSPMMRRGMVFAGAKRKRVPREQVEYDDDELCESPCAKKSKRD